MHFEKYKVNNHQLFGCARPVRLSFSAMMIASSVFTLHAFHRLAQSRSFSLVGSCVGGVCSLRNLYPLSQLVLVPYAVQFSSSGLALAQTKIVRL